jgi:hypothetical protein
MCRAAMISEKNLKHLSEGRGQFFLLFPQDYVMQLSQGVPFNLTNPFTTETEFPTYIF